MGEISEAVHPAGRSSTVELENPQPMHSKGVESINTRVAATVVSGNKERSANTFIQKASQNGVFNAHQTDTERYWEHYNFLKQRGFPVPTTVRKVAGSDDLLITDLTENGTKRVFSSNEIFAKEVNIQDYNAEELRDKMLAIADKADQEGIKIWQDAYFFIVDKDNNVEVILGDLGLGIFPPNGEGEDKTPTYSHDRVVDFYKEITKKSAISRFIGLFNRR